jgi:Uma2 family endonuclease
MVLHAQEYYPEEGPKLGQGLLHAFLTVRLLEQARRLLGARGYFCAYDMFLYPQRGTKHPVSPDLMCAKRPPCSPWKLWEHGAPELVVEICSPATGRKDVGSKWKLYEQIGVSFYVVYDAEGYFQPEPLTAWELVEGKYRTLPFVDGFIKIQAMEMGFRVKDDVLQMTDVTGVPVLTDAEEAAEQRALAVAMEERARMEKQRADLALSEADRFRQRLLAAGIDPDAP